MVAEESLKLYYSIGEVADMFGVNTSLIRFWEKEFDVIKPHKNKKGFLSRKKISIIFLRAIPLLRIKRGIVNSRKRMSIISI